MPFESKRLGVQLQCYSDSRVGLQMAPKTIWQTIYVKPTGCATPTIQLCPNHSRPWCFKVGSPCLFDSCGPDSPIVVCPAASEPCFGSPVEDTPATPWALPQDPIPIEPDPEDPEAVLLRPEHLPRLRGQLQLELAQIEEIAQGKGEIESQLEELDSVEKELKKRSGER